MTDLNFFHPKQLIETKLAWEDLILNQKTFNSVKEIEIWLNNNKTLNGGWNIKNSAKPGYKVVFQGPSGTGKTLTANLLGKYTKHDVYRVDLSLAASKFIGETEKNLANLFDKAITKGWILFFDEADALFGKRTKIQDSQVRYATQEVAYLLERIEAYPGLIILSSNFKSNLDTALSRGIQSVIEFKLPSVKERLALWKNNLANNITLHKSVSLEKLAEKYQVTGANIVNIVEHSRLKSLTKKSKLIQKSDLLEGINKEFQREGKKLNL